MPRIALSLLPRLGRAASPVHNRAFSTTLAPWASEPKVPIALIAQLRKINPISMSKAKEALAASEHNVEKALKWLEADLEVSGAKKAEKVGARSTENGAIGVTVMGTRAAMVELRCETDFVSRNSVFQDLVKNVTCTAAFLDAPESAESPVPGGDAAAVDPLLSFPTQDLSSAPLMPSNPDAQAPSASAQVQTVFEAIRAAISTTGENVQLARAITFASPLNPSSPNAPFYLPGVFSHGSTSDQGSVAALAVLALTSKNQGEPILKRLGADEVLGADAKKMARAVARQAVGFPTTGIAPPSDSSATGATDEISPYLLKQPFMMYQNESRTVAEVVAEWAAQRLDG